jgi:RNA polymerase sigma-70 factor (ECF subfamily)
MERLLGLIQRLRPLDRQVMLLYLEDIHARAIGEIVGLSAANVATKIHRVKKVQSTYQSPSSVRRGSTRPGSCPISGWPASPVCSSPSG